MNKSLQSAIFLITLFITEGNVEFDSAIRMPADWDMGLNDPYRLTIFGPQIDPGEKFIIRFSERGSFTLEWAELLGSVIQGSGSLFFENGGFVGIGDNFTSNIPTPIAKSFWLLGSGLIGLVGVGRKLNA